MARRQRNRSDLAEARPAPGGPGTNWLYGRHAVAAALANPARRCRRILALPEQADEIAALVAGAEADLPQGAPEILDRRALAALLPAEAVHQGMALAADPLPRVDLPEIFSAAEAAPAPRLLVVLDQVSDPHNVGAVLRSAAAFGALAVIVTEHGAAPVTGALAKAASGALETVPLVRVANLARSLEQMKAAGFWCVGLDPAAEQELRAMAPADRMALVLGAEGAGLRRLTRERCDLLARVPMRGRIASLNLSNAAAIALYEFAGRRG